MNSKQFSMLEPMASVFNYLTHAPINFWVWLLPVAAPLLVFSAKPDNNWKWRIGRLILAIGITYALWNLTINTHHHLERIEYDACQSRFSDGEWRMPEECGNPFIGNGAQIAFGLILSWIPAAGYVGFWELLWRRKYRHKIEGMGTAYKKRWFSTVLIVSSIPMWIWFVCMIMLTIFMLTVCPEGRVATDKCWF